jgi:Acyclic terpene utilisation family protein AtuA
VVSCWALYIHLVIGLTGFPGASGSATDRRKAMAMFAHNYPNDPVDVIIGDWMSEANMTSAAGRKTDSKKPVSERFYDNTTDLFLRICGSI